VFRTRPQAWTRAPTSLPFVKKLFDGGILLDTPISSDISRRVAPLFVGGLSGFIVAYAITSPTPTFRIALYGAIALAVALSLPPHVFLPAALLLAGVSTAFGSRSVSVGPIALYVSDLATLLIFARGIIPRARRQGNSFLSGAPRALFVIWLLVMAVAGIRARLAGIPTVSVVRDSLALFYWPLLYVGFTRVLAEPSLDKRLLWRNLSLVAVGFAMYMFAARAFNHPFKDPGLAHVATGQGETVLRNFGFAAAFTIYPVFALAGIALMANTRDRLRWTLLASLGVVATLTTLVRGTIFSLSVGILLVLWLSPRLRATSGRAEAAIRLALAAGVAVFALLAIDPKLGHAVIQRSLPFTHQAQGAIQNADYRFKAMGTGIDVARAHPTGIGALDQATLLKHGIDPGYLVHSGFALLLIYGGWLALGAAILTLIAVIRRSFSSPAGARWIHPAFVGAITMLSLYTLSAAGLAGDPWVVPLGALIVALRFGLPSEAT
jgi:hypothetical protein